MYTNDEIKTALETDPYLVALLAGIKQTNAHEVNIMFTAGDQRTGSISYRKSTQGWTDFAGDGKCRNTISFVQFMRNISFPQAMLMLLDVQGKTPEVGEQQRAERKEQTAATINVHRAHTFEECTRDKKQSHLIQYLEQKRGINLYSQLPILNREGEAPLRFVSYFRGEKHYTTVGFRCDSGGYAIRNEYHKGALGALSPTYLPNILVKNRVLFVFEGFIDFLSFLTENPDEVSCDFLVLNSLSFITTIKHITDQYVQIGAYLDNDLNPKRHALALRWLQDPKVFNMSVIHLAGYKDYNEYLTKKLRQ